MPKGFFPVQDTGVILGISEAPQSISFTAMAERQQALARVIILKDPAVASLSSFIGVDGTNATLNSGRILINLKPLAERRLSADDVIRRLQPELAQVEGITLFLQPVQDLTVEDRVSRTQYQYSLEDADGASSPRWAPRLVDALRALPELRDVSSDQQDQGLGTALVDRPRHGVAARHHARRSSTTRSTTPSASGRSRRSSRSSTSTASSWRSSPASAGMPTALRRHLPPRRQRRQHRCRSAR